MMFNYVKVGLLLVLSSVLVACSPSSGPIQEDQIGQPVPVEGGGEYIDITPQELNAMLAEKDFFFVNVHIPYEGEIPRTDAFIAFDEVTSRVDEFPSDKEAKIVLYCRSGSMSAISARDMVQAGYSNIFNLDGGFRAWSEAGFEFIK